MHRLFNVFFKACKIVRLLLLLFVERLQAKPMPDEEAVQERPQDFLEELPSLVSQKLRKCA